MTLEMRKFNMKEITFKPDENKGPVIAIGRRDTGKSFLLEIYYIITRHPNRHCYIRN